MQGYQIELERSNIDMTLENQPKDLFASDDVAVSHSTRTMHTGYGDIEPHMKELYDIDISDSTIRRITDVPFNAFGIDMNGEKDILSMYVGE